MKLFLFFFFVSLVKVEVSTANCVWYGQCREKEFGFTLNCLDDKPARLFNDTKLVEELKNYCPDLANKNGDFYLCCDSIQIDTLLDSLQTARVLFATCPSCQHNFMQYFCQLTCSPDQSDFMFVQKTKTAEGNRTVVLEVEYLVSEYFAKRMFDSCKWVQHRQMNILALDWLCGHWGQANCTAERWLSFIGNAHDGVTMYLINATLWDEEVVNSHKLKFKPMNATIYSCNEGFGNRYPCTCGDCPASCPIGKEDV